MKGSAAASSETRTLKLGWCQRHGEPGRDRRQDLAENVVFLKRSMRPGFAGIENELLYNPKTTLVFGDAKDTLTKMVAAVKAS